ncbi:MAG: thioredoxin family protein [Methanobacterium paludis]|uniref:Uncharacterized protein n=2 Tax=Methanobacterium paludis (strain DSM 25820 / JCM 18151 / SWAN1) TaxID=868131 RepID=F6D5Q5_METPW|nr:hypothetical protein MSWAN_1220 [Methanobacterium paludis]MCE7698177.1 thioredoxin family protein [Methanobacterium paludis]
MIIDGEIKSSGNVLSVEELKKLLKREYVNKIYLKFFYDIIVAFKIQEPLKIEKIAKT